MREKNKNLDKIIPRLITSHLSLEKFEGALFYFYRFYSHACTGMQNETTACISLKEFLVTAQLKEIIKDLNVTK